MPIVHKGRIRSAFSRCQLMLYRNYSIDVQQLHVEKPATVACELGRFTRKDNETSGPLFHYFRPNSPAIAAYLRGLICPQINDNKYQRLIA